MAKFGSNVNFEKRVILSVLYSFEYFDDVK